MKRILVTGATGFIGRHVLGILQSRGGYEVHGVTSDTPAVKNKGIFWHQADLLDAGQTDKIIRDVRPELLLHLAWYTEPGQYLTSDNNLSWEKASIDIVRMFYENGGQRMVGAGTCAEYAWGPEVLSEIKTPLQPATLYGKCKLRVSSFLEEYSGKFDKSSAWGRIFFLYGPFEDPHRLVPSVICSLLQNKPALCMHGEQIRDFLYVEDAASAFVALLESNAKGAVNIASGEALIIRDIVNFIGDKLNRRELIRFGETSSAPDDSNVLVADAERLKNKVGWRSKYTLDAGLEETISWWKDHMRQKECG